MLRTYLRPSVFHELSEEEIRSLHSTGQRLFFHYSCLRNSSTRNPVSLMWRMLAIATQPRGTSVDPASRTHLAQAALVPAKGKQPVGGLVAGSPYMQCALNYRRQHLYMCVALENIRNRSSSVGKANLNMVWNNLKIRHMLIFAFCSSCCNQPARRCVAIISIKNTRRSLPSTRCNIDLRHFSSSP